LENRTSALQLVLGALQIGLAQVHEHDLGALGQEQLGAGEPHAPRAAGDEAGFVGEQWHGDFPELDRRSSATNLPGCGGLRHP
jgi:hypothetical protein